MIRFYPFIVGLAYLLPAMHQSSLGALMLLGRRSRLSVVANAMAASPLRVGCRVPGRSPVWRAHCCFAHSCGNAQLIVDVLVEMNRITAGLIGTWLLFRFADILFRGVIESRIQIHDLCGIVLDGESASVHWLSGCCSILPGFAIRV